MPEHGPQPNGEDAKFSSPFGDKDQQFEEAEQLQDDTPINEVPILITPEEKRLLAYGGGPEAPDVKHLMESKGIPFHRTVKMQIGDEVLLMSTDPNDFGTRILPQSE